MYHDFADFLSKLLESTYIHTLINLTKKYKGISSIEVVL